MLTPLKKKFPSNICKSRLWLSSLIVFLLLIPSHPNAQDIYNTVNGQISFVGVHGDTSFVATSNKLVATLDYSTGMIKFRVDLSTIETKNDSLQERFHKISPQKLTFDGNINKGNLNTKEHGRRGLLIGGDLSLNRLTDYKEVNAFMICYPAAEGDIACQLSIDFNLNLEEYELDERFPHVYENMNIQISQAILERKNE